MSLHEDVMHERVDIYEGPRHQVWFSHITYICRVTEGDDAMFTRAHENATPILTQYMYSNHGPDDYDEMSIPDETPYSFSH